MNHVWLERKKVLLAYPSDVKEWHVVRNVFQEDSRLFSSICIQFNKPICFNPFRANNCFTQCCFTSNWSENICTTFCKIQSCSFPNSYTRPYFSRSKRKLIDNFVSFLLRLFTAERVHLIRVISCHFQRHFSNGQEQLNTRDRFLPVLARNLKVLFF